MAADESQACAQATHEASQDLALSPTAKDEDGGGAAMESEIQQDGEVPEGEEEDVEGQTSDPPFDATVKKNGVDPFERLAHAYSDKEKGLEAWKREDFEGAIEAWSMARGTIKHILERKFFEGYPDKIAECEEQHIKMHLNLAQASLKNKEFHQAITFCNKVLFEPNHDPKNIKALYHRARAQIMGSLFVEANKTLSELLAIEPGNPGALQLRLEADRTEKAAKAAEKKVAQKISKGMKADHDVRIPPTKQEEIKDRAWAWLTCRWCRRRLKKD